MQYSRKVLKFITFLCLCFVFFVGVTSCISTPASKIDAPVDKGIEPPPTIDDVVEPPTIVQHKRMNKVEFGTAIQSFLQKDNYDEALSLFSNREEVEDAVLEDMSTKVLKLSILVSANKTSEALLYAEELEKEEPDNLELLYCRVMMAQGSGDQKMKDAYLQRILEKYPKDSWAITEQGLDLYSKKNYKRAKDKFLVALKHSPRNVEALLGLARVHYMQNKLKDAQANLELALEEEPNNSLVIAEIARIKSETDRMLEAIKDIKKAIEIDDKIPSHWMDLGLYNMQIGKKKEAEEAFSHVIELDPNSYMAFIYRAGINDEMGQYKEALEDYNEVIKLYPSYYFAFEGAGILYIKEKEWNKGATCFREALKRASNQYHYAILLAFCLYKEGKAKEAKNLIKEYIKSMDKDKKENEYFLTRLFFEQSGDADVGNRIMKIKDKTTYYRMMFYMGAFYEITNKNILAEKYYIDVLSAKLPSFIEYRLAQIALDRIRG